MSAAGRVETSIATERPIQFSVPMVRAILAGVKTQTRRVILPVPDSIRRTKTLAYPVRENEPVACKFGEVGDRLWVRERCAVQAIKVGSVDPGLVEPSAMKPSMRKPIAMEPSMGEPGVIYAADGNVTGKHRWRPSYMMPRWACRIILEITSRRIERLSEISTADARSEGFIDDQMSDDPIIWFQNLWDSLCKPEQNFQANPWVWVIGFRVIQPE